MLGLGSQSVRLAEATSGGSEMLPVSCSWGVDARTCRQRCPECCPRLSEKVLATSNRGRHVSRRQITFRKKPSVSIETLKVLTVPTFTQTQQTMSISLSQTPDRLDELDRSFAQQYTSYWLPSYRPCLSRNSQLRQSVGERLKGLVAGPACN